MTPVNITDAIACCAWLGTLLAFLAAWWLWLRYQNKVYGGK